MHCSLTFRQHRTASCWPLLFPRPAQSGLQFLRLLLPTGLLGLCSPFRLPHAHLRQRLPCLMLPLGPFECLRLGGRFLALGPLLRPGSLFLPALCLSLLLRSLVIQCGLSGRLVVEFAERLFLSVRTPNSSSSFRRLQNGGITACHTFRSAMRRRTAGWHSPDLGIWRRAEQCNDRWHVGHQALTGKTPLWARPLLTTLVGPGRWQYFAGMAIQPWPSVVPAVDAYRAIGAYPSSVIRRQRWLPVASWS